MPFTREIDEVGGLVRIKAFDEYGQLRDSMSFGVHLENDPETLVAAIEFFERNHGPKDSLEDIGLQDVKRELVHAALANLSLDALRKL